jgi:hypothetical protein
MAKNKAEFSQTNDKSNEKLCSGGLMDRILDNLSKTWPILLSLLGFLLYVTDTRNQFEVYTKSHTEETKIYAQQNEYIKELTVSNKRMIDILSEKTSLDHDSIIELQSEIRSIKTKIFETPLSRRSN